MAHQIELSIDDKNYSAEQREYLARAFLDHGFDVKSSIYFRKSIGELAGYVLLNMASNGLYDCMIMAVKCYEPWLRDALHKTLLKAKNKSQAPTLQLEANDGLLSLTPRDKIDLDTAFHLMSDLTQTMQKHGFASDNQRGIKVYYIDGIWKIYTDGLKGVYEYNHDTKSIRQIS